MNTKLTARHFELTPELKNRAEENFDSLQKFHDQIISCHLILDVEKHRKMAEMQIKVHGQVLTSTEESDDMHVSIEAVFDKARQQLKKYKEKLKLKDSRKIAIVQSEAAKPHTDVDSIDY